MNQNYFRPFSSSAGLPNSVGSNPSSRSHTPKQLDPPRPSSKSSAYLPPSLEDAYRIATRNQYNKSTRDVATTPILKEVLPPIGQSRSVPTTPAGYSNNSHSTSSNTNDNYYLDGEVDVKGKDRAKYFQHVDTLY